MPKENTMDTVQQRLSGAKATIALTVRALSTPSEISSISTSTPASSAAADFPVLLKNLLAAARHSTTSLALSFKPPITIPAALQQTDKLVNDLCQAASCVIAAAESDLGGGALQEEWKDGVSDICAEVGRFLDVLYEAATSPAGSPQAVGGSSSSNENDHPYLHHTALVWDIIDKLVATLSVTEADAVIKRWKADTGVVRDAWSEFKESIEGMRIGEKGDGSEAGEDGDSEGWDGEGLLDSDTMTEEESKRIEAIKAMLQLYQLLHAAVPRFIPSVPFSRAISSRDLLAASSNYATAFDDLICALYPEHDADEIDEALRKMAAAAAEVDRLMRIKGVGKEGEAFLSKWQERMRAERLTWKERLLHMDEIAESLQRDT